MYYIHVLHTAPYSCQPDRLATLRFSASSVVWDRQHCRLSICDYRLSWTNTVSEAKIQITLLILRRGALSMISWLFWKSNVLLAWLPILAVMWGDRVTLASFCFLNCLAFLFCFCVYLRRALLYSLPFACVRVCVYLSANLGIWFEVIHYTG